MELIGHVMVDSGQVMVGDPCYLDGFVRQGDAPLDIEAGDEGPYAYSYSGAARATLSERRAGELEEGLACAAATGVGDGTYPVYVTYEGGRVASLTVVFLGEDGDLDPDEDEDDESAECDACGRVVDRVDDYGMCNACREEHDMTGDEEDEPDDGTMPSSFGG